MKSIRPARYYKRRLSGIVRSLYARTRDELGVTISAHMQSESRTLLLAFGGLHTVGQVTPFEFVALTGEIPVKRLFVRDPRQAWYHRGMRRHGATLDSVAESLGTLLAGHEIERLVVAGASSGGYAALIFGTLLGADTVVCFSPQTVVDLNILASWDDHRWDFRLVPLAREGALEERWLDLRRALPEARKGRANTRYQIYFDETVQHDRLHAEHIRGIEGARLYRFGRGGHRLVRTLRDSGALEHVLRAALGVLDTPSSPPEQGSRPLDPLQWRRSGA